jgi:molybdenum-dependent DNA-binding transcriptional regulator ModE
MTTEARRKGSKGSAALRDQLTSMLQRIEALEAEQARHAEQLETLELRVGALYAVRQIAAPRRPAAHLRPSDHGEG